MYKNVNFLINGIKLILTLVNFWSSWASSLHSVSFSNCMAVVKWEGWEGGCQRKGTGERENEVQSASGQLPDQALIQ